MCLWSMSNVYMLGGFLFFFFFFLNQCHFLVIRAQPSQLTHHCIYTPPRSCQYHHHTSAGIEGLPKSAQLCFGGLVVKFSNFFLPFHMLLYFLWLFLIVVMLEDIALLYCFCSQCVVIRIKCIQMPLFWKSSTHSPVDQHANRNGSMGKFLWRMSYKNNYWELISMWTVYKKTDAQWINNNNYSRHLSNATSQNYHNETCCVASPVPTDKQRRKDESQLILAFFLENIFSCGEVTAGLLAASITATVSGGLCKLSCSSEGRR